MRLALCAVLLAVIGLGCSNPPEPVFVSAAALEAGWSCPSGTPPAYPGTGSCDWFPADGTNGWSPRITPCAWGNYLAWGTMDLHSEHGLSGHCARAEGAPSYDGYLGFSFTSDAVSGAGWRSVVGGSNVRVRSVQLGFDSMAILCEGTQDGAYPAQRCTGRQIVLRSWHFAMVYEVPDDFDVTSFQLANLSQLPLCSYSLTNQHLPTQATYCGTIGPSGLPQAIAKSLPYDSNPIVADIHTGAPCMGSPAVGGIVSQNTELIYGPCPAH